MISTDAELGTFVANSNYYLIASCEVGDIPISGGYEYQLNRTYETKISRPLLDSDNPYTEATESLNGWMVVARKQTAEDTIRVWVICADMTPDDEEED